MPAKPLQMAMGSLMIQKQYGYSDRELVEQITENPYYQYFVGLLGFQNKPPFVPSLLVEFRKHLNDEIMTEINEMIIAYNAPDDQGPGNGGGSDLGDETEKPANSGTIILDATCMPQNISYPQDINLLNETRENLEKLSFDAYNESDVFIGAVERYRERTGHYPDRGLGGQRKMQWPIKKRNTLTILVMNVARIVARSLRQFLISLFSSNQQDFMFAYIQNRHSKTLVAY